MVIIYMIINLINGKIYIGSTNNISSRFNNHRSKLNRGIHENNHLQNAWNKYGYDSFEFKNLMVCSDSERNHCEQMFMDLYEAQNRDFGYNIRDADAHSVSEETKKKMSEASSRENLSKETLKKMSEAQSGKNNNMYGRHHTEESIQKMSETRINKGLSKGENNPNAKYTLWDITKCHYNKNKLFRNGNDGMNPRRCFVSKYNGKKLPINMNLDFYTPELINDLINEFLEVN